MKRIFRWFVLAVGFLTVLPAPLLRNVDEKDFARSLMFYPVVGFLLGFLLLATYHTGLSLFPAIVSLALTFIALILLSGGLHLDGFADMCDGFYAGKTKEDILRIMKDSHVGAMGIIGIFCVLMLKLALWFSFFQIGKLSEMFLVVPSISRWMMTAGAGLFPYARPEGGTGLLFVENAGASDVMISTLFLLVIVVGVLGTAGILLSLLTFCFSMFFLRLVKSKIGGVTGDTLGAVNEISEIFSLMILLSFYQKAQV